MDEYRVNFDSLSFDDNLTKNRRTKTFKNLRLVEYSHGLVNIDHWCEKGHTGYILEGEIMVEFENPNKLTIFNPGNGIVIPEGVRHRIRTVLSKNAKVLMINT